MARKKSTRLRKSLASVHEKIEAERRQLNKAVAVLIGAELTAEYFPNRELVSDAIDVAREFVEQTIEALDSARLKHPVTGHKPRRTT